MNPPINKKWQKGADLALQNANSLIADAELLAQNNSFGHATSLLILAGEELAKSSFCRILSLVELPEQLLYLSNEIFRNHGVKLEILHAVTRMENAIQIYWPIMRKKILNSKMQNEAYLEKLKDEVYLERLVEEVMLPYSQKPTVIKKIKKAENEERWWKEVANESKQDGLYVKLNKNRWIVPTHISRPQYLKIHRRILSVKRRAEFFTDFETMFNFENNFKSNDFKQLLLSAMAPASIYIGFIASRSVRKRVRESSKLNKKRRIEIRPTNG